MAQRAKPLSPHLEIYRFTLTMAMSIVHRATGIANYAGMAILTKWLVCAALGGAALDLANGIIGSWFGQLVLFGFSWSLIHHALGGIRHFVWDNLKGLDPTGRELIVRLQLGGSIVLTLAAWALWVWR